MSGILASFGTSDKAALDLESKAINAAGGVDGHPIQLLYEDDESDPSKGVIAEKKIIDQKPVLQIGPVFSSVSLAVMPLLEKAKIPTMLVSASDKQVDPPQKYIFMVPPPSPLQAHHMLNWFKKVGVTGIAVLHDPGAYGASGAIALKAVSGQEGVKVLEDETYALTDTDMTPHLSKIKANSQVKGLVVWGSGSGPQIIAAKNLKALGFTMPVVYSGAAADIAGFVQPAGAAAEGLHILSQTQQLYDFLLPNDPSKKVLDDFLPRYRQAYGKDPNQFAGDAYGAIHIVVNALKAAGGTDPDKLAAAFEQTKYDGASGHFQFGPGARHAGLTPDSQTMAVVKGGKLVPATPNCDDCFKTKSA
ncbi:MAG: ABC transporter substrate-binding protein [Chloroflexota bacterium]|nr:ABC transporter substrate-binding protein [Chloroflexota bacterium]